MPWYLEAWDWIKDHPYIALGGTAGVIGGYLLLHHSSAQQSPLAGLTPSQQFRLQSQSIAANSPLAIARVQASSATAQANAAARAQIVPATAAASSNTAIARAQAATNNLVARLGLTSNLASIKSGTTLGLAQNTTAAQENTLAAKVQAILASIGLASQEASATSAQNIGIAQALESGYAAELGANASTLGLSNDELNINPPMFSPLSFGQSKDRKSVV